MRKRLLSILLCGALAGTSLAGCGSKTASSPDAPAADAKTETTAAPAAAAPADNGTTGTNTFVDGGTEMALWTFQELHVNFYTEMADKWNEGDTRCVLQGGTGTSVTNQSTHQDLAKEFLAFAKLSEDGNVYIWEKLGFDPIRTSLWDDEALTTNPDNKFIKYFQTNPFDVLNGIRDEYGIDLTAPDISGAYAGVRSVLGTTTYTNAFEIAVDEDVNELLKTEQASVIYDE